MHQNRVRFALLPRARQDKIRPDKTAHIPSDYFGSLSTSATLHCAALRCTFEGMVTTQTMHCPVDALPSHGGKFVLELKAAGWIALLCTYSYRTKFVLGLKKHSASKWHPSASSREQSNRIQPPLNQSTDHLARRSLDDERLVVVAAVGPLKLLHTLLARLYGGGCACTRQEGREKKNVNETNSSAPAAVAHFLSRDSLQPPRSNSIRCYSSRPVLDGVSGFTTT